MSLIKNYVRATQEIEDELALIDDELYLAMLETQMTDWSYILNDDNAITNSKSVTYLRSTRPVQD